jgi:hypothetical protein
MDTARVRGRREPSSTRIVMRTFGSKAFAMRPGVGREARRRVIVSHREAGELKEGHRRAPLAAREDVALERTRSSPRPGRRGA